MAHQLSGHYASNLGDLTYLLYLPTDYVATGTDLWPMILFLHGVGESGTDLSLVKVHGIPQLIEAGKEFPCIVVSPQCPLDSDWTSLTERLRGLIQAVIDEYAVDPRRIYVTGLSMGGEGTWALALRHRDVFAALAPICGDIPAIGGFLDKVRDLRHIPIWIFHGAQDTETPIETCDLIVSALRSAKGNVRYTVYPEGDHYVWTETYNNPEFYTWMLSQSRAE